MDGHISRRAVAALGALALSGCIPPSGYQPRTDAPAPEREGYERRSLDQDVPALPAPRPAWEARPVTPDARRIEASTYVVRSGDSLRSISVKTGAGSEAIARANDLAQPYTIFPGQRLTIPAGLYHAVREGETGIAIARAYRVDWSRIISANYLEEPYVLRTGQRLLIPNAGPETIEERAARFHIDIDDILTGGTPAAREGEKPARPTPSSARVLPATKPVAMPARLTGQFRWPVTGNIVKRFGPGASGERNDGIKIAVPLNTPVLASADGVVAYVGSDVPALGGLVILSHGGGWTTVYGHARQLLVQRGQSVKRGQTIALSGNSGFADRPEVHFEMRQGRSAIDPVPRLPAR
ncbi:M23 family metallopeptidase [Sphingomonas sp.]|uniref:M23 family metallopeptidase n=1 Tax=Sphingomonas sp. TaxID=28214 RepID=UPI002ED95698